MKENYKSESLKLVEENHETVSEGLSKCFDFISNDETLKEIAGDAKELVKSIPIVGTIVGSIDMLFKIGIKAGIMAKDKIDENNF